MWLTTLCKMGWGPLLQGALFWSTQLLLLDLACVEDFIGYLTNRSHRLIFHQGL